MLEQLITASLKQTAKQKKQGIIQRLEIGRIDERDYPNPYEDSENVELVWSSKETKNYKAPAYGLIEEDIVKTVNNMTLEEEKHLKLALPLELCGHCHYYDHNLRYDFDKVTIDKLDDYVKDLRKQGHDINGIAYFKGDYDHTRPDYANCDIQSYDLDELTYRLDLWESGHVYRIMIHEEKVGDPDDSDIIDSTDFLIRESGHELLSEALFNIAMDIEAVDNDSIQGHNGCEFMNDNKKQD